MTCHMRQLVEAHHDGRLSDAEARSVERHLDDCNDCRRLRGDLARLGELGRQAGMLPAPAPLAHRRRRLALLKAVATPPPRRRRPVAAALALAAGVMAAALVALAEQAPAASLARGVPPVSIPVLEPIDTAISATPGARFEREVALDGATRIERVRLHAGTLDIEVHELRGDQRFLVTTRDADVEVRGTRFRVRAAGDALEGVSVTEGTVELRRDGHVARLGPGSDWAAPAESADGAEGLASPPVARVARPAPRAADPSEEFARALSELEAGNYGKAGASLEQFASAHADDARAEDAAYLVIVAMQRAGRQDAARQAARAYLARFPDGARRAEVARIANAADETNSASR